ncbi:MAG: hypothetical protein A3I00_05890 [Betaproteobacteria bacterium RIFCSPLOWO2_02_FULL_64_12]|nr:MAG: hypothetical protein A3I00_05890 [Betaproteobacteria bacterium RIFCSPLOWO2_02_FULL_64_12]
MRFWWRFGYDAVGLSRGSLSLAEPDAGGGAVSYLGVLTAIGLALLLFARHVLAGRAAVLVEALAFIVVVVAGAQFLFHGATLVSAALEGQRRKWFQIAVALAAPVMFALILVSRADAIPLRTLWDILTPYLLFPLGVIAWVCWYSGGQLNREHPFRGFLIAAAILGVLCLAWSAGMTSEYDDYEKGSSEYFDPEKARRGRETGVYVWRVAFYVTTAYLVLFLRLRQRTLPQR